MTRAAAVCVLLCLLVPASAGTSTARPSVALRASPVRVMLNGAGQATIRVVNTGTRAAVVAVRRAGFALDLRGRPKIVRPGVRAASAWLTLRPERFMLQPGRSAMLAVGSKPPAGAEPGDHDALVLLTTQARTKDRVTVRMRVGVLVVVRTPGMVVRRLQPLELRLRRVARSRVLELLVANRGNVTERMDRRRASLVLRRAGMALATLRPVPRDVRPRTRGLVEFRYRGPARGRVTAVLQLSPEPGKTITRAFRLRL